MNPSDIYQKVNNRTSKSIIILALDILKLLIGSVHKGRRQPSKKPHRDDEKMTSLGVLTWVVNEQKRIMIENETESFLSADSHASQRRVCK